MKDFYPPPLPSWTLLCLYSRNIRRAEEERCGLITLCSHRPSAPAHVKWSSSETLVWQLIALQPVLCVPSLLSEFWALREDVLPPAPKPSRKKITRGRPKRARQPGSVKRTKPRAVMKLSVVMESIIATQAWSFQPNGGQELMIRSKAERWKEGRGMRRLKRRKATML